MALIFKLIYARMDIGLTNEYKNHKQNMVNLWSILYCNYEDKIVEKMGNYSGNV